MTTECTNFNCDRKKRGVARRDRVKTFVARTLLLQRRPLGNTKADCFTSVHKYYFHNYTLCIFFWGRVVTKSEDARGPTHKMDFDDVGQPPDATDSEQDFSLRLGGLGLAQDDSAFDSEVQVNNARNFYQAEDNMQSSSDGVNDDSGDEGPGMHPTTVYAELPPFVEQKARREKDITKLRHWQRQRGIPEKKPLQCLLCEVERDSSGTGSEIKELFNMVEREWRTTNTRILYDKVVLKGNAALKHARKAQYKAQRWNGRRFTRAECRLHFEGGHVRTPLLELYKRFDELSVTLDYLRPVMWEQQVQPQADGSPSHYIPDPKALNAYDQTLKRMADLAKLIVTLEKTANGSSGTTRSIRNGQRQGQGRGDPSGPVTIGRSSSR